MKITLIAISLLLISCSTLTKDNGLNAITSQQSLHKELLAKKYNSVEPIDSNEIIGDWKVISSYFTIKLPDGSLGNTVLNDKKWIYHIRPNGIYYINNEKDHLRKWELTENNTTFFNWGDERYPKDKNSDYEQWKIRIALDTMEWILIVDGEYLYEVLVKQK